MKKITNIGRVLALAAAWSGVGVAAWSLAIVAPAVVVSGCAAINASPRKQYLAANQTYNALFDELETLKAAGKIAPEDYQRVVVPALESGDTALRDWQNAILTGNTGGIDYVALVKTQIDRLVAAKIAAQKKN